MFPNDHVCEISVRFVRGTEALDDASRDHLRYALGPQWSLRFAYRRRSASYPVALSSATFMDHKATLRRDGQLELVDLGN